MSAKPENKQKQVSELKHTFLKFLDVRVNYVNTRTDDHIYCHAVWYLGINLSHDQR